MNRLIDNMYRYGKNYKQRGNNVFFRDKALVIIMIYDNRNSNLFLSFIFMTRFSFSIQHHPPRRTTAKTT